jgi:hypothetical protein
MSPSDVTAEINANDESKTGSTSFRSMNTLLSVLALAGFLGTLFYAVAFDELKHENKGFRQHLDILKMQNEFGIEERLKQKKELEDYKSLYQTQLCDRRGLVFDRSLGIPLCKHTFSGALYSLDDPTKPTSQTWDGRIPTK